MTDYTVFFLRSGLLDRADTSAESKDAAREAGTAKHGAILAVEEVRPFDPAEPRWVFCGGGWMPMRITGAML